MCSSAMKPPSQIALLLLLSPLVALSARPPGDAAHVVSLEDVTGTTPRPAARPSLVLGQLVSSASGSTEVGYPEHGPPPPPPRPHGAHGAHGVVSLEDVTGPGYPGLVGHLPPPPQPGWPGADAYRSPCYPSYGVAPPPPANVVPLGHTLGSLKPLSRSRRSPSPKPGGVVRLEDVAGPVAARYPAFGPPAYVRPARPYPYSYDYWGYGYGRPRPYYAVTLPLPCIGDAPPDAWLARRPVLPVSGAAEPVGLPAGHQHPASSEWSRPERLSEEPGHREDDRVDDRDDDVPREFVRQL